MARTRSPDLEGLIGLDANDLRLVRLQRELDDLPQELRRAEGEVKKATAELEAERAREKQLKRENDQTELDIRSNKDQIGKYRIQQNTVKTNDEYSALKRQIAALEEKNLALEEQVLERMYALDEGKARQAAKQAELKKVEGVLAKERAEVEVEMARVRAELDAVRGERDALLARVSPDILKLYERIRERAGGRALARIDGARCQACFIEVPSERVARAHQGDEVVVCPMCSRILFID